MNHEQHILALGLGLEAPWKLTTSGLDTGKNPHELHLHVEADRGALYPCPTCNKPCKAHDFKDHTWRHLNFFQHYCYLHARVPRTNCPEHGVLRTNVPWARPGNSFTLLFEQAVIALAREMPIATVARFAGCGRKPITRIIKHYVDAGMAKLDLGDVKAVALDETASKRGHNYITVFADMEKQKKPVIYACEGKGKNTVERFAAHLKEHGGDPEDVTEVVCDMSPAFIAGMHESLPNAKMTVDWFHIMQLFTRAVDNVRKLEAAWLRKQQSSMPKSARWALLKGSDAELTESQADAMFELEHRGLKVADAWYCKEALSWVREAESEQAAKWRLTNFVKRFDGLLRHPLLRPMQKALRTLNGFRTAVLRIWRTGYSNARLESLNSLFQAARARARGYSKPETFIMMVYLLGAELGDLLST